MPTDSNRLIVVGSVIKPHGIKGEVVVELHNDSPDIFICGNALIRIPDEGESQPLIIEAVRGHQGRALVKFEGFDDRSSAETLRGIDLYTEVENLPPNPPDEYYFYEIVDARVVDTDGTVIGTVQHILESGPGFLLEIKTPRQTFLLPFVAEYVREVNRERGEIVVQNYRELLQLDQS